MEAIDLRACRTPDSTCGGSTRRGRIRVREKSSPRGDRQAEKANRSCCPALRSPAVAHRHWPEIRPAGTTKQELELSYGCSSRTPLVPAMVTQAIQRGVRTQMRAAV